MRPIASGNQLGLKLNRALPFLPSPPRLQSSTAIKNMATQAISTLGATVGAAFAMYVGDAESGAHPSDARVQA